MKSKQVLARKLAQLDVERAFDHYLEEAGSDVAERFVDAYETAIKQLSRHPQIGSPRYAHELGLPRLRSWPLKKFPYLIFYVDLESHLEIWRVSHSHMDIPAWLSDPDSVS